LIEPIRKCGYRTVGKVYIVGNGMPVVCDNLPYPITPCDGCGFEPQFTRGFSWLRKTYIKEHAGTEYIDGNVVVRECKCLAANCPICNPNGNDLEQYGMMWVGAKYYTPEEFISESDSVGVSKAINKLPKDLVLGKTWIVLAHKKVPMINEEFMSQEPDYVPAIFYAFVPTAYEMLIWDKDATDERIAELKGRGITPIIVPDDDVEHSDK